MKPLRFRRALGPSTRHTTRAGVVFAVALSAQVAFAGGAAFSGTGEIAGGPRGSQALGVSADGRVVVGGGNGHGARAFRFEAGTSVALGLVGAAGLPGSGLPFEARDASEDGSVVVGSARTDAGVRAFRWRDGSSVLLRSLPGGPRDSAALAVSDDGLVAVGYGTSANGVEAIRFGAGAAVGLGDLPGGKFFSRALAVSGDGTTIVGQSDGPSGGRAVRWRGGELLAIEPLPERESTSAALGLSRDGRVIVGVSRSSVESEAFRWEAGTTTGLGDLPGGAFLSIARSVSADGSVIVGKATSRFGGEAFVWTKAAGMRPLLALLSATPGLDVAGWRLTDARAVSADGRTIVGFAINPAGAKEGFVATLAADEADIAPR